LYNQEELSELFDRVKTELIQEGMLLQLLSAHNRAGDLDTFMDTLGLGNLLKRDYLFASMTAKGNILVLGALRTDQTTLKGVAKELRISKDRFEFIDYDEATNHDYKKYWYSNNWAAIIAGETPHSGTAMGEYSSNLRALEDEEGYPRVKRIEKINKTQFCNALKELIGDGIIAEG